MRKVLGFLISGLVLATAASVGFAQSAPTSAKAVPIANQPKQQNQVLTDERSSLSKVRRVYVESFGEDSISKELHAMIVSSLVDSKRFIVTENKDRADAVLKGSGLEKTSQEVHAYEDSTVAGGAAGGHSGSYTALGGSHSGGWASRMAGISDSSLNTESINNARLAIRLVDAGGDVIWATTQESKGAKYKGATADVVEKAVKQLLRDCQRAEPKQN